MYFYPLIDLRLLLLLPPQGFGPDDQNPWRHPRTPLRIERKISLYPQKKFENTARKGLRKVRWGSNKQAKDSGSVLYTTRF